MKKTYSLLLSLALLAGATTIVFAQPQTDPLAQPEAVADAVESPAAPAPTEVPPMAEQGLIISATIEGKVLSIDTEKYQVVVEVLPGKDTQTILVGPADIGRLKIGDAVKIQITADNVAGSVEIIESEVTTAQ